MKKEIVIDKVEGKETYKVTVGSWRKANDTLTKMSMTAPMNGGYDKTKFTIKYEDGTEYTGRYDLKHYTLELPDLFDHVYRNVKYRAMTSTEHKEFMSKYLK